MTSIRIFFRSLPLDLCQEFIRRHDEALAAEIDWTGSEIFKSVTRAVRARRTLLGHIQEEVERIAALDNEAGEAAMRSIAQNTEILEALPGNAARALWMFLYDPVQFRLAEEVRYTDEHRRGRIWSGFEGPTAKSLSIPTSAVEALKSSLQKSFGWGKIHIDLFERSREAAIDERYHLLQLTIYREGWPNQVKEFVGEELQECSRRPVYEAAVTYEPLSGSIEVVSQHTDVRREVACLFCINVLGELPVGGALPLRHYDLSSLKTPHGFPNDPDDRIESVRVTLLRLVPPYTGQHRVTLEALSGSRESIWEVGASLGPGNPLQGPWVVTQAKLVIRFHPLGMSRQGRTLPIVISTPHGCDLKERTARERLIGQKYLARWGLQREQAA